MHVTLLVKLDGTTAWCAASGSKSQRSFDTSTRRPTIYHVPQHLPTLPILPVPYFKAIHEKVIPYSSNNINMTLPFFAPGQLL